jgi:hypothetical protein
MGLTIPSMSPSVSGPPSCVPDKARAMSDCRRRPPLSGALGILLRVPDNSLPVRVPRLGPVQGTNAGHCRETCTTSRIGNTPGVCHRIKIDGQSGNVRCLIRNIAPYLFRQSPRQYSEACEDQNMTEECPAFPFSVTSNVLSPV